VPDDVEARSRAVLEQAWDDARGYCYPNRSVYPHQWLWDSCFHAIAWAALGDARGLAELRSALSGQLDNGFVPHMRFSGPTSPRGPLPDRSGFTQPPVYALAARELTRAGQPVDAALAGRIVRAFEHLWQQRRQDGLLVVLHPWETGCDDSPRWDSWMDGRRPWDRKHWRSFDRRWLAAATFGPEGDAVSSSLFTAAPSAFNGITAHGLRIAGELLGDSRLTAWADELGAAMEDLLWDDEQSLYVDRALTGGGPSCSLPTLDGVLGALGALDRGRAVRALDQLRDPQRFKAPHGLAYVPRTSPDYEPDAYWRGPAWPQLTYLAVQACRRWGLDDLAADVAREGRRAIHASGYAEYWNPETGQGCGAQPQTWAALACALT